MLPFKIRVAGFARPGNCHNAFLILLLSVTPALARAEVPAQTTMPGNRVATIYIAEDFVNEQLSHHVRSKVIQEMRLFLDPKTDQAFLRGVISIPTEELRAINLDPRLGKFSFQVAIKLETTKQGHLVVDFPLNETFFYPFGSKNPTQDRVVIPVQMLSLALASARGYLAAISGDFGGFDRRTEKLKALMKDLDRSIAAEKNQDALDDLKNQRESLRLQLEAVPIERKQLLALSKEFASVLGFTGEKELNLNNELAARKNALILKIKLDQLTPYLQGYELGSIRIRHDEKDGGGQNYLAIDVNDPSDTSPAIALHPAQRPGMKIAPSLIMRLNQSLLESQSLKAQEKKDMGSNLRDFDVQLKDDGLHVSGVWKTLLFFSIPFDTVVDFVGTGPDVFEVRVRDIKVGGIDFEFLSKFVLESLKKRLHQSLKGLCKFKYVGEEKDHSRALQVSIDPKELVPAFPDLHLVGVDVRDHEFLLKVGRL